LGNGFDLLNVGSFYQLVFIGVVLLAAVVLLNFPNADIWRSCYKPAIFRSHTEECAVQEVSLEIESGEVIAIVGDNGAGKSTLTKMLAGAVQPDSGSAFRKSLRRLS
jgi:ABC-type protease/lipase transport system fused ATPase/permease subunit